MSSANNRSASTQIAEKITKILDEGSTAALVTLISAERNVGAKLLVQHDGDRHGSLGAEELDDAVIQRASLFLQSKDETLAFAVKDFAPQLTAASSAQVLFEEERAFYQKPE